jgi:glycine/D-amino acid oxidase-like deaminating enzyme
VFDYIIIGQGIAGSLLSWFLIQQGQKICVIDSLSTSSASHIASGITNPITGRKFVKTWLADELLPFAHSTYTELESIFNQKLFEQLPIVKLFDSIKAQNDWSTRSATPDYLPYLKNESIVYLDKQKVANDFGGFEINGGTRLAISKFLLLYRDFLIQKNSLLNEPFSYTDMQTDNGHIVYKNIAARKVIFCEGASALHNPYFRFLPFVPAKGECLIIEIDDFYPDRIINGEVLIMPTFNHNEYYVGATHEWNFYNDQPSENGKNELLGNLNNILRRPFKIINHKAAIRPTVKDRRPFIGFHPEHSMVGIFNGMGTKGISLAPYFANHFTQHLLHGTPLMKEVDIRRFYS